MCLFDYLIMLRITNNMTKITTYPTNISKGSAKLSAPETEGMAEHEKRSYPQFG